MYNFTNPEKGMHYLSEWLDELPANVVISKGLTGCGATTLAIDQPKDTIIAVPYTALITNKIPKHKDILLGLFGPTLDRFKSVISDYLSTHTRIKIMTTYDSLPKVCATLTALGHSPYEDMHLVIDEWHLLFASLGFREDAKKGVFREATRFRLVTYLSATPVDREYWFKEMSNLKEWKIEWPDARPVKTHKVRTTSPVKTAAILCKNRIIDGVGANYHMFMNSVKGISEVIQLAGLKPENCRIICANTSANKSKLPEGFDISSPGNPVKTINFYTSTCFEGCDIYDPNGRTFIICDPNRKNTILDISTSMRQICGRIRNTRYKHDMTIIFNTTRYEDADTFEAYKARVEEEVRKAEKNAKGLNELDADFRNQIIAKIREFDAPFISIDDDSGLISVNHDMVNLDLVSYKNIHEIFGALATFDEELERNNFHIVQSIYADTQFVELMTTERMNYKDCCEQYAELKAKQGIYVFNEDERMVRLRNLNPEACNAIDLLGIDEVRRMKYHKQNIHRQLVKESTLPQKVKIKRELDTRLNKFEAYTIPTIKKTLGEIYGDVGLGKTPKATDLSEFYRLRKTKKEGHDAYVIEGDAFIIS